METVRKVLFITFIMSVMVVMFTFIGFHMGYDGLILVGEINLPDWAHVVVSFILFYTQFTMVTCIVLNDYSRKILPIVALYIPIHLLAHLIPNKTILSSVIPLAYLLIISTRRGIIKRALVNCLFVTGAVCIYQAATLIIKTGYIAIGYTTLTHYALLICSIDLIIYLLIIFAMRGERYVALGVVIGKNSFKYVLFPENSESPTHDSEDLAETEEWKKLIGFKRVKNIILLLAFQLLQWTFVLFVCALGHVFYEGLIITISFIAHGFVIRRRWHSNSILICTLLSATMFYVAAKAIPTFGYSQLFPVIVGLLLLYAMYRVALYTDKHKVMQAQITELTAKKPFRCATASETDIRARCLELGKSDEYADFVVLAFRSGKTRKEIAEKLFISENTVKEYKRIRKKELETE